MSAKGFYHCSVCIFCVFEHGPTRKLEKQEMHYHFCGVGWHGTTEESLVVCLRYMCLSFLYQTEKKQKVLVQCHVQFSLLFSFLWRDLFRDKLYNSPTPTKPHATFFASKNRDVLTVRKTHGFSSHGESRGRSLELGHQESYCWWQPDIRRENPPQMMVKPRK